MLDLGGSDVNGSYREIFAHPRYAYTVADIDAEAGVHLVLQDPYRLPLDDGSIDIVISGQMLEHCEFFWLTFVEMVRVLRPGGFIFLIAPSSGPEHRYPVDCYRFYPDAYRALARYANCQLVDLWCDERGPWKDLVGVFSRRGPPPAATPLVEPVAVDPASIVPGDESEERTQGHMEYIHVLNDLHQILAPRSYLEIGVRFGRSLALATGPAIGVDPAPEIRVDLPASTRIFTQTSDDFFAEHATAALAEPVDFAFIDGLHLFEAALRDFMNIERIAAPEAIVAIDDVLPNHPAQAERQRRTRVWTGDVWRLAPVLRRWRPDLALVLLDTSPSGLLLVTSLDPSNRVLWENYNPIVREALAMGDPPPSVLSRTEATSLTIPAYDLLRGELAGATRQTRIAALLRFAAAGKPAPESEGGGS
ncbi:MAG: methyltransferase domain-containing protein [Sphingomonas sp.]